MRLTIRLTLAAGIAYCLIAQAIGAVPPTADDIRPVARAIAAINAGDMAQLKAQFTNAPAILDEFAPFLWTGAGSQNRYASDFSRVVTDFSMTNIKMTMGRPLFNYVQGDRAYVVVPITVTAMLKGKPYTESGSNSYALERQSGVWRISAQTWTKHSENFNPY